MKSDVKIQSAASQGKRINIAQHGFSEQVKNFAKGGSIGTNLHGELAMFGNDYTFPVS
jgi:hypothetical protein